MKNIKFLYLLVAALFATAFTACQQEWEPGQPDSELCVYFPVNVDVAPFAKRNDSQTEWDDRKQAGFPVYRQESGELAEMTVEIRSRFVNPDELVRLAVGDQYIYVPVSVLFTPEKSVTFKQGETVAYLYINLASELSDQDGNKVPVDVSGLSVGSLYNLEVLVKDVKHQGNYGLYRKTLGVGIPETWKVIGTEYEGDLKLGTFTEDFFTFLYGGTPGNRVTVTVEESEARAGVYRLKNLFSQDNIVQMLGGVPSDMSFATGDTYIIVDASKKDEVYIPWQYAGFGIPGYMDEIYIASGKAIGADNAKVENDGKKFVFPANTVGILDASGSGRFTNESGLMAITLPGLSVKNYELSLSFAGTESVADNSETRAYFNYSVGADVSKYRFVVVEGNEVAYTTYNDGTAIKPIYRKELHPAVKAMLEAQYNDNGDPMLDGITDEYIKDCLTNSAEVDSSFVNWYITLPKSAIYTMFAVAYDENGNTVKDEDGNEIVARTHFYYHPANENHEGGIPDLKTPNIKFASITDILTAGMTEKDGLSEAKAYYDIAYPACFYLGFDIQSDDADLVSQLAWYYTKTADLPKNVDPYTLEGQKTLINEYAGEDKDISYQIAYLKEGGSPMVISATPDTEYTVVLAMTSIYGKTSYYTVEARTTPYSFNIAFGTYSFVDGNSKMTIEIEPFYNAKEYQDTGNGELFYFKWVVEDKGPYVAIREYPFIGFNMPEYNAIVTYGQVNGYSGSFFAYDFPVYTAEGKVNPDQQWGFQSSSTPNYSYDYESMVLYYDENGVINKLGTYFRQYVKTTTVIPDDPNTEENEERTKTDPEPVNEFSPETTVVTCVVNKKPVLTDSEPQPQAKRASFSYGAGRMNKKATALKVIKDLSYESVSIL